MSKNPFHCGYVLGAPAAAAAYALTAFAILAALWCHTAFAQSAPSTAPSIATAIEPAEYRATWGPVDPASDATIIAEAEEFHVIGSGATRPAASGWEPRRWGENYYAATFANTFLSRKAFLGAPAQADDCVASIAVRVPKPGRYLALVRYEAAYRFQTQFRLRIEQNGRPRLDRLYGARENPKIWAFHQKPQPEVAWSWGAVENVVWEGHDALVDLDAGEATLSLVAGHQPEPAARRNVDLVMLTRDLEQVRRRIEKEGYLPLDGMLTQAGDLYLKLRCDHDGAPVTITVPQGVEHSPYWVHQRDWSPRTLSAAPDESTDWMEVGSLLDTLNDGQWRLSARGNGPLRYTLEFGVPTPRSGIQTINRFEKLTGDVELAYNADTRYTRRIEASDRALHDLVNWLKERPVPGVAPRRTLVYGHTFDHREKDPKYNEAIADFIRLMGATALTAGGSDAENGMGMAAGTLVRGYVDLRDQSPEQLKTSIEALKRGGRASRIAVVSLGDEIGLPDPPADGHEAFRAWLKGQGLAPQDLDPASRGDWNNIRYDTSGAAAKERPGLFYYSHIYRNRYGIGRLKLQTDELGKALPNAGIGANFSPHQGHCNLGNVAQWVSLFREGGLTMPWGEDYAWQVPVGSQQMNGLSLDLFRAGVRDQPAAKIQYYVMAHAPGNTPASWRRQFYADIGHGVKIFNLFEFRPVQAAYTENHVTGPAMYQQVRRSLHELGRFEDLVQDGHVRPGVAALWFSEAGDIWDDNRAPFDAAKRTLYVAIRQQQLPLDVVVEADAVAGTLKDYRVLYLTDQHVSRAASRAIADWVAGGGQLFATAGAGMRDEFDRPNERLRTLLGVHPAALEEPADPVRFEKQDLPFAVPVDQVSWQHQGDGQPAAPAARIAVIGVRSRFTAANSAAAADGPATIIGTFADGSPAVAVRHVGRGTSTYCGFLPGLSYFKPAIPLRPVDRGTTDDAMDHFIPTDFDLGASALIATPAAGVERPVLCSEPRVEASLVESEHGTLIPLVNWTGRPLKQISLTFPGGGARKDVSLAGGGRVIRGGPEGAVFTFDLDVADALILR